MPFLRPVLKLLKADVEKMDEALAKSRELEAMAMELASIPDRFNDHFAGRGWIIYEQMNLEAAKSAIEKADAGDIDGAEADLVEYYSTERVTSELQSMVAVEAFRPRMRLAEKALDDYNSERYHACIPVVLALLDGMVSTVHEQQRGFFAEESNLQAWDSIAAHDKGLDELSRIFRKTRRKTRTEAISVPYRHGILHGMDLGYDNRMVAAKSWAALFAAREWAIKAERGLLGPQPEEKPKTWKEIFAQIKENEEEKRRMQAWEPRSLQLGADVPATGDPHHFEEGTPERKLAEYLTYWKAST